jgi:hypothetical protein
LTPQQRAFEYYLELRALGLIPPSQPFRDGLPSPAALLAEQHEELRRDRDLGR